MHRLNHRGPSSLTISVALATYNGGTYLRAQLDSILAQSVIPNELIISDDCSTDNTIDIAAQFRAEAPFPVIIDVHSQRLGYTANFIRAINQCSCDLVATCDQDDVWLKRKLESTRDHFDSDTVMIVAHRVQVTDECLAKLPLILPKGGPYGKFSLFTIDPWFSAGGLQMLFRRNAVSHWLNEPMPLSKWYRANAPFDEWIFYLAMLRGECVLMRDILTLWRRHGSSTTGSPAATVAANSTSFQMSLALTAGSPQYLYQAEVAQARAKVAARFSAVGTGTLVQPVPGAANFYCQLADRLRRRAELHHWKTNFLYRLTILCKMIWRMDYRARWFGGLGLRSLVKDVYAVIRTKADRSNP